MISTPMPMPCFVLIVLMLVHSVAADVKFKAGYHDTVTLTCDERALGLYSYTVYIKYWVTPLGEVIQWFDLPTFKYTIGTSPEYNLTINNINSKDFGWYRCVILWDNYIFLHNAINVGLNVEEVDYSGAYNVFSRSALIGGVTAIITCILFAIGCFMYAYCNRKAKPEPPIRRKSSLKELDRVVNKFDRALFEDAADFIYRNEARDECHQGSVRSRQTRDERDTNVVDTRSDMQSEIRADVKSERGADWRSEAGSVRQAPSESGTLRSCACCEELSASLRKGHHHPRAPLPSHQMERRY